MQKIFRFDDVCINANLEKTNKMANYLKEKYPSSEIWYCISPIVHDMSHENNEQLQERIFPKIFSAYSSHLHFYEVDKCGIPEIPQFIKSVSHGLIHVDHRLLSKGAQEMSILTCCNLVKSKIFVPPFNKWNKDTEEVCNEHNIELIKFEDGWLSMEHNVFNEQHFNWYVHARAFTFDKLKKWVDGKE